MSKKILTIVGARPQFIKAAAVSRAMSGSYSGKLKEVIVHTGQHYDYGMSQLFFDELNIPAPAYNLGVGSFPREEQIQFICSALQQVLEKENPEAVLVYGDTNSTLAGAKAATSLGIPVVHVEAGLRSFNLNMPEENNRIETDKLSSILFVPTQEGIKNLEAEGITSSHNAAISKQSPAVFLCGDVMYDNALFYREKIPADLCSGIKSQGEYVLTTIHRDHNTDNIEKLTSLIHALIRVTKETGLNVVFPLHPRTSKSLNAELKKIIADCDKLITTEPFSYLEIVSLLKDAQLVLTDSGGLQKEAYFFHKPCVILRPQTEWVELVNHGAAILADTNVDLIVDSTKSLLTKVMKSWPEFYGDGHASEFICEKISLHI